MPTTSAASTPSRRPITNVGSHAQFTVLQRRLGSGDALNEYVKQTSSAVFAIPAGTPPGGYLAHGLFA